MKIPIIAIAVFLACGCSESKPDLCASIRSEVRAEMKATQALTKGAAGPEALREHAELLGRTSAALGELEIEDARVRKAVSAYVKALDKLKAGESDPATLGAILSASRKRVADACNEP
jgi:hypothetical protein